jgi:glucose uptake protein
MIQPTTGITVLVLLILSALCWGSWINTFRAAKQWRFEYFYYDFTLGVIVTVAAAAFTLGSMNPQDLTFQDNFLLAAYRKMAWAIGSGVVFNLGNLFLLAATAVSGLSVAFPISFGMALVAGAIWDFAENPQISIVLAFGGIVLVAIGVAADALAYSWRLEEQDLASQQALKPDPRAKTARPKARSPKSALILAMISGLVLTAFFPMLTEATSGETGVSAYGAALLLAGGMAASTLFFVPFFLFFPVLGGPGQIRGYFRGDKWQHALGVLGGVLWGVGILASLLAAAAPQAAQPGRFAAYTSRHVTAVIAMAWGFLLWREFRGSSYRVRMMLATVMVLLLAGASMVAVAPIYAK